MTEDHKGSALKSRHQVSGEDYPGEWARQFELFLDQDGRRALFYGGFFVVFVLAMVCAAAIGVILDMPPNV
jgi:hypothetical protein